MIFVWTCTLKYAYRFMEYYILSGCCAFVMHEVVKIALKLYHFNN